MSVGIPAWTDLSRSSDCPSSVTDCLQVLGVSKSFGGVLAVRDCSIMARRSEIVGLIGPNGAGKSTLLSVVSGQFAADCGSILYFGEDISAKPPHVRAQRGLIRTFQISRELGALSVLENLLVARPKQQGERLLCAVLGRANYYAEEERSIEIARDLLVRVRMWGLADQPARALSGAQKKLLELCRAVMAEPKLILLDEPAAGVSPPLVQEISQFVKELRDERQVTFIVVEHDMGMVASLCDRVYVLAEGRNLVSGTFDEVTSDERVVSAYLGGVV